MVILLAKRLFAVNSFNTSLNGILNYFSLANVTVKYKLFKSVCMPLYGSVSKFK